MKKETRDDILLILWLIKKSFISTIYEFPKWIIKKAIRTITCMIIGHDWGKSGSYISGSFIKNGRYCKRCDKFESNGPTVCR